MGMDRSDALGLKPHLDRADTVLGLSRQVTGLLASYYLAHEINAVR